MSGNLQKTIEVSSNSIPGTTRVVLDEIQTGDVEDTIPTRIRRIRYDDDESQGVAIRPTGAIEFRIVHDTNEGTR